MDRRTAIKNLAKGLGVAAATPTIMHILVSCQDKTETWEPLFLSAEEKHIVTHLSNLFIPKTDTLGALDVNVPQFLDMMYHDIELKQNQDIFKKGATYFSHVFTKTFNKPVASGTKEDFNHLLDIYFNRSETDKQTIIKRQNQKLNHIPKDELEPFHVYKFLFSVRYYAIFGYCTSEEVGETILAYDPVPGNYLGCIPLEEATQGKTWSL
ncbi:gluconate 2-dehydrogenase subunit 3 family protein [Tamlana fucoidanivorans]|nr:gluconate 2-dehydrogenase subunit 3 family protein [Tamlana fucoidanivorans]